MKWLERMKPTDAEVLRLAQDECDPAQASRFEPICWGFFGNLVALGVVGTLGVLASVCRALRGGSRG